MGSSVSDIVRPSRQAHARRVRPRSDPPLFRQSPPPATQLALRLPVSASHRENPGWTPFLLVCTLWRCHDCPEIARKAPDSTLNGALSEGVEWTEAETVGLGLIEAAADRVELLKRLFDGEVDKPELSTRRVAELSAEIRQTEANIGKWVALLDP